MFQEHCSILALSRLLCHDLSFTKHLLAFVPVVFVHFVASVFVISLFCSFCRLAPFVNYLFINFLARKLHRVRWFSAGSLQTLFKLEYTKMISSTRSKGPQLAGYSNPVLL